MKSTQENSTKMQKLSSLAKKVDKQLMELLVSELKNFRNSADVGAIPMKIA